MSTHHSTRLARTGSCFTSPLLWLTLMLSLSAFAATDSSPSQGMGKTAKCENCCGGMPCESAPPQACTFTTGSNAGCSGLRYYNSNGTLGPCGLTSSSRRSCGSCGSGGTQACLGNGSFGVCQPPTSREEVCNSCDDNWDGTVDNISPSSCQVAGAKGVCATGVKACSNGANVCNQTTYPSAEFCDGVDNDCNGEVDEFGTLSCGVGACARTVARCTAGNWQTCTPGTPTSEVCDNVDNDCDGSTDENLGMISCGQGACANSVPACVGGVNQTCVPRPASAETCDGLDNDCDSLVDEDNACRFEDTSCACIGLSQAQACAQTACGSAPNGCGGTVWCGTCPTP